MWSAERAQKQLEKEGRTKAWVAKFCGIEIIQLNHYLAGRRVPRRPVIKLIAMALNTTEEYLMGEDADLHQHFSEKRAVGS